MPEYRYPHEYLRQYIRIPEAISSRLDSEFPGEYPGVRHCLGLVVTNMLAKGTVAYSRNSGFYTERRTEHYTYANMMRAVTLAEGKGWATNTVGFRGKRYSKSISSTVSPTARLKEEFAPVERLEVDLDLFPPLVVDGRPIYSADEIHTVYRSSSVPMPLPPTTYNVTFKLQSGYFSGMRIGYGRLDLEEEHIEFVRLTRVFREGGVGKWYQRGGLSYQELHEEDRAMLLLNGEEVIELDYSAMHPHLLYSWEGKQCPEGFYEAIMGECGCSRSVAKEMTMLAINSEDFPKLSSAINLGKGREEQANLTRRRPRPILYNELKEQGLDRADVVEAIRKVHPAIARYIYARQYNRLMLEESEVLASAMLRLMELGIPSLPVHDSLIAPRRHREQVKLVMEDAYHERTGFTIPVG